MKTPWERQVVKQMSKRDNAEFTAFVSAQWNALFRTAFLAIDQPWFPETPASTLQELQALIDSMHIERS
jgi:hypothetical protein